MILTAWRKKYLAYSLGFLCLSASSKLLADLSSQSQIPKNTNMFQPIFDLPVTYNYQVSRWIEYFQGPGRRWFQVWLERSGRYLPYLQKKLSAAGLPTDLVYMVMIESGFDPRARSRSGAVGPWQFIESTGKRYGLRIDSWVDERMDIEKSTQAAILYLKDLYQEFGDWHLVAASYNMGENGLRRLIQKYKSRNFWLLAKAGVLPHETRDYVPKILASMLISKAPTLYGFSVNPHQAPLKFEKIPVKRGWSLKELAQYLKVTEACLKELNPHLLREQVPQHESHLWIKVPPGSRQFLSLAGDFRGESFLPLD